jgi:ribonuclease HII
MTALARERAADFIRQIALAHAVGLASAAEIDQIGILPATRLAARRALEQLTPAPDALLIDYIHLPQVDLPQTYLTKGDRRSLAIAAAAILAKTTRDALLVELDIQYPQYGFAGHKGYATARHLTAIEEYGPCPVHRHTFSPIKPDPQLKLL